MGAAGLALSWLLVWVLVIDTSYDQRIHAAVFPRADRLGPYPWYRPSYHVHEWQARRWRHERQVDEEAAARPYERKWARVSVLPLPVEVPSEPSLTALR